MTRAIQWKAGDYFAIKLASGSYVLGQIIDLRPSALNSVACGLFSGVFVTTNDLEPHSVLSSSCPIAVFLATRDLLDNGAWKIVGHSELQESLAGYKNFGSGDPVGKKVIGSKIVCNFVNAFWGLLPWDVYHDAHYFDKLLLPGVRPAAKILQSAK